LAINNSMAEREKSFLEKLKDALNKSQGNVKTRNARDWFQRKARALKSELRSKFTKVDTADEFYQKSKKIGKRNIGPGSMFAYFYDPKYKKELKYYDRFPLVLVFDFKPNGFIGCNMHYLPPLLRAKLMDEIDKARGINWKALSRIKEVKPTVKRYLYKHISSKVVEIADDEREIALFLPTERFKKESKLVVWGHSRSMIK
tara:strand:+ start:6676 stop:7278 length:603 start_codon:yes stop_codon:yes gene_type:complete